jgi:hypothetical protein
MIQKEWFFVYGLMILMLGSGIPLVHADMPPGQTPSSQPVEQRLEDRAATLVPSLGKRLLSKLSVNGYLRNETAFRINHPSAFTKMLNIVNLESRYFPVRSVQLTSRIRAFYDTVYDFEDIDTISPRRGPISILSSSLTDEEVVGVKADNVRNVEIQQQDVELKELYLDVHLRRADLRLGKQIVRWGVVEGARVTDEINPLDLSEFILRDVEDRYIPLWLLKSDFYWGDSTLEAIWIPDVKGHEPAPRESEWEQFRLLDNLERPASPLRNPVKNIKNSELAFRLSRLVGGWDLSFSYFYTWDDFPAAFRSIGVIGFGATPQIDPVGFKPRYPRLRIPGLTLSKSLGKVILNAEAAYVDGKVLGVRIGSFLGGVDSTEETVELGEIQRDLIKYAVGLDTTLWRTDISGQILQQYILGYQPNIIQDEIDTVLGLFIRRTLLSNALTAQALTLYFINDKEWLIRPRLSYSLTDQLKLSFGADLLIGTISDVGPNQVALPGEFHFVGFFRNNSRVYTEVQYSF